MTSPRGFEQNKLTLLLIFCIALAIPLLVSSVQHRQTIQQRAAETSALYWGVYVLGLTPFRDVSPVTAFENNAQKKVSLIMFYQKWFVTDGTQHFMPALMNSVRSHGSIPVVTWEPWDYSTSKTSHPKLLQRIINGEFDAYITKWALDSKAWGHPYFLRFAHEMNGDWYPWAEKINGNSPGQYVQAWKHVHDIFTKNNVTNVTWVWSPHIDIAGAGYTPLQKLYPGDAYVDWLAMDGYNWGTSPQSFPTSWQTFHQTFDYTYKQIEVLSQKPIMIAETASAEAGGNKAAWITDALTKQLPAQFPRIKALIWFHENKETDWRIESSAASKNAFVAAIKSPYFVTNNYGSLNTSPIPPPGISSQVPTTVPTQTAGTVFPTKFPTSSAPTNPSVVPTVVPTFGCIGLNPCSDTTGSPVPTQISPAPQANNKPSETVADLFKGLFIFGIPVAGGVFALYFLFITKK